MAVSLLGAMMCANYELQDDGRLDLLGLGEIFYVERLPSELQAYLVLSLRAGLEQVKPLVIELHFRNPVGHALGMMSAEVRFERPPNGRFLHANPGIRLHGAPFADEGEYSILIWAGGRELGETSFGLYRLP